MKKLLVLGFALFLVAAFTLPAAAVEHKFGGYFRTRFMHYDNARGIDETSISLVDTRTRLKYTAVLNDDLKFFFQNEFDSDWGGGNYGRLAADGQDHQVKNIYIDFNLGDFNFVVGTQGFQWARSGFLFDDDATGIKAIWRGNKNLIPALYWLRYNEGDNSTAVDNKNGQDSDLYTALVNIKADKMQIVPYFTYWYASDGANATPVGSDLIAAPTPGTAGEKLAVYYAGLDFNMKLDPVDIMFTGIYQGGDVDDTLDVSAYLLDVAAKAKLGGFGVHGEVMYATGDDNTDNTVDAFVPPPGASYTWSEGYAKGAIDDQPFRSPLAGGPFGSKEISDLLAVNLGTSFNLTKTWNAKFDYWWINLAEDNAAGDKDIGNEVSLTFKGKLVQNLDVLLVGAYMFAGDAFNKGVANDKDPFELAAQLSISF